MEAVERLIEKFSPSHYDLFLDLNRADKRFEGRVRISGQAKAAQISLHQRGLAISAVTLDGVALPFTQDDAHEALHIELGGTGQVTLDVVFSGQITDNMDGIYPSYYSVDGVKKEIIATQFESHFARQAFPCVDEPEAKATFDLSLKFDQVEGEVAFSNMPEIEVESRQATGIWRFATTPRMSTYLLAFAFGELQGITTTTKYGTLVGAYSTKAHKLSSLDFALDIAKRTIEFYEDYFGVKYPIPQSLHLALPDFSAGAMENWGLVTYREVYLLLDDNSTVTSRQNVALVIAHEVAHQWFGNLVTMKWWDDLWLNESFANMMEYVCLDAIEPEWHIFEDFQTSGVLSALSRDATDGVQSVHVEVKHPDEINTLFDAAIVYAKGSRLMHMLRRWLGDAAFRQGLGAYFQQHQYGNTIGQDLWQALSEASGRDVAGFMDAWLEQPGYPVLTATVENDTLKLRQQQFFIGEHAPQGRLWPIPLNSSWTGLPDTMTTETLEIPNFSALAAENKGPLRFNTENTAHYIIDYQGELLDQILSALPDLDATTKLQIVQDRRLLAEAGQISYADLVPILSQLAQEKSYMVSEAVTSVLANLERFIDEDTPEAAAFYAWVQTIAGFNYARLGFEAQADESDKDELVRQNTLAMMLLAQAPDAVVKASQIFEAHRADLSQLPAAIRGLVLTSQMRTQGDAALANLYLDYYTQTTDGNFQRQLSQALSYTKDAATLTKLLAAWQDKDVVKPQDLSTWNANFLRRNFTQEATWTWARDNWDWLKAALGGDMSFDAFVVAPAYIFKTAQRLAEYRAFFEPQLSDLAIQRNIQMGIKQIAARVALIDKDKVAVATAIKAALAQSE